MRVDPDRSEKFDTVTSRRAGTPATASPSASLTSLTAKLESRFGPPILRKVMPDFGGNESQFAQLNPSQSLRAMSLMIRISLDDLEYLSTSR